MRYVDLAAPFEIRPFFDGDSCYIVYNIRELPSTKFDGAGGLVAVAGKETVVGRLDLEFGDIMGTGRAFNLKWNKKDKWSSELSVGYLEPFLLQSDFDLRLEISQRDLDSSFIKSSGQIGFVRSFHSGLSGHLWLGAERTVPEPHSDLVRSNSRFVGLEFDYDKTDDPLNPKSGYGLSSSVEYKNRTNSISDSIAPDLPHKITTADMKARYFGKISRRAVLAIQGRAGGVVSSDGVVPRDEFFYLGGFDNLRGYAEKRFPAYRYFMVSLEPRLLTGDFSRIYTFVDIAQIKGSQNQSSEYNFYPGYGVGVMAPSAIGQFKLEIGWGKTGFPDDGVVNFGLAGQF
jgi:outer membrane protein assembly factor BamA